MTDFLRVLAELTVIFPSCLWIAESLKAPGVGRPLPHSCYYRHAAGLHPAGCGVMAHRGYAGITVFLGPSQVCPLNIKGVGNCFHKTQHMRGCGDACDGEVWCDLLAEEHRLEEGWAQEKGKVAETQDSPRSSPEDARALQSGVPRWPALFTLWGGASGWPRGLWANHGPSGGWDHGRDYVVIIADLPNALLRFHVKIMPWIKTNIED